VTTLVASDYRGALDFLRVLHDADEPPHDGASVSRPSSRPIPVPAHVLAALRRLIPSAIATYHAWDPVDGYRWELDGVSNSDVDPIWARYVDVMDQDPLPAGGRNAAGGRVAEAGRAIRFSDVLTLRELRRLDLHSEMCRPFGIDHVMKLFLAVGDTGASIVLESQRRPFSERDRELLDVLGPHLSLARRRWHALARPYPSSALGALSVRERDVLRLVAAGMTNREVGLALFIATGTVRKHLDNIYAKLDVRSRAQAVMVAAESLGEPG
jgi:DNA-binding CsgD family transcriptional regulator